MRLCKILALGVALGLLSGPAFAEHEGKGKFHSTKYSCRVSEFLGATVVDQSGDRIGQLKDVVLQPQSGKADLAIISLSMPNQKDKLTAVPWQLLRFEGENRVMLTTDRDKLMSAMTFESSRWPEFDTAYNQRIYTHYGLTYPVAVGGGAYIGGEVKGPAVTTKENEGFKRPQPDGKDTFEELNKSPEKNKDNDKNNN
jgi:sporulation protein YlmC with PRC-barrel domain